MQRGSSDFGFWILDFGFWILDFGFWILDSKTQNRRAGSVDLLPVLTSVYQLNPTLEIYFGFLGLTG
ncbi:MAG TPA: hypothetical protein DCL61_11405 [Cyanobacteria bacterium UBA12227]|nr:hypothetical protein [Cyanobacteria bacterium UBA12227]